MAAEFEECVLCKTKLEARRKISKHDEIDEFEVDCPVCGRYQVAVDTWELYRNSMWTDDRRFLLSALAKTAPLRGAPPPRFTQQSFRDAQAGTIREPALAEKRDSLLLWIERLSRNGSRSRYGAKVNVDPAKSYPAAWCRDMRGGDWTEWNFTMSRLIDGGLIKSDGTQTWITNPGWDYLESRPRATGAQCFVAMAFRPDLGDVYAALSAGVEAAGYRPLRIDGHEFSGGVMDEILAQIRRSKFLVADLTYNRGGVYREEGFALGLGLPTIHTCREDHIEGDAEKKIEPVHFDVRHLNLITWTPDKLDELTKRLTNRVEAVLGRGPL